MHLLTRETRVRSPSLSGASPALRGGEPQEPRYTLGLKRRGRWGRRSSGAAAERTGPAVGRAPRGGEGGAGGAAGGGGHGGISPTSAWHRAGLCRGRLGRAPRVAGTVTHTAPGPRWNAHVRRGPEGTPATPRAGALDLRAQP